MFPGMLFQADMARYMKLRRDYETISVCFRQVKIVASRGQKCPKYWVFTIVEHRVVKPS